MIRTVIGPNAVFADYNLTIIFIIFSFCFFTRVPIRNDIIPTRQASKDLFFILFYFFCFVMERLRHHTVQHIVRQNKALINAKVGSHFVH